MPQYTVSESDCSDKSLARRPDTYMTRKANKEGIIETDPVLEQDGARENRTGDSAAREETTHQPRPLPTPLRVRREPIELEVTPPQQQPVPQAPVPQHQVSQAPPPPPGPQPRHWLLQLFNIIMPPSVATPDTTSPQSSKWQLISITWVSDKHGWHFRLTISHSARRVFAGLIIVVALVVMGKLTDALEIFARLFY